MNLNKITVDKKTFLSSLIALTTLFLIIFGFLFSIISFNDVNEKIENTNQVIIYLKDLEDNQKKEVSKKILELPGVSSLTYESKQVALKAATVELGVEVSESENPLSDAFFVYVDKTVDIDQLKNSLLNISEINAIDLRSKAIQNSVDVANAIHNVTTKLVFVFSVLGILMLYHIISFSIRARSKEIYDHLQNNVSVHVLKKAIYVQNAILLICSSLLGFVLYKMLSFVFHKDLSIIVGTTNLFIGSQIAILLLLVLISLAICYVICFFLLNSEFAESNLEKEIEEQCNYDLLGEDDEEENE